MSTLIDRQKTIDMLQELWEFYADMAIDWPAANAIAEAIRVVQEMPDA